MNNAVKYLHNVLEYKKKREKQKQKIYKKNLPKTNQKPNIKIKKKINNLHKSYKNTKKNPTSSHLCKTEIWFQLQNETGVVFYAKKLRYKC